MLVSRKVETHVFIYGYHVLFHMKTDRFEEEKGRTEEVEPAHQHRTALQVRSTHLNINYSIGSIGALKFTSPKGQSLKDVRRKYPLPLPCMSGLDNRK